MDYIESLNFLGFKANEDQALQWPRYEVYIDGYSVDGTEIPNQLKLAVYEAIKVEIDGYSEMNPIDRKTISETVGDISVTYTSNSASKTTTPALSFAVRKLTRSGFGISRA